MWFFECCTAGDIGGLIEDSFEEIQEPFSLHKEDLVAQPLVNTLSQLWRPLTATGAIQRRGMSKKMLFKETSFHSVDVNDLLTTITRTRSSLFSEPGIYSISSHLLSQSLLDHIANSIDVSTMYPNQIVELRKKILLIYTPANKNLHNPYTSEKCDRTVGFVEVALNSAFTGGEVNVHSNGQNAELKAEPYSWAAVHADASSCVRPVTSGARVSLIYDIVAVTNTQKELLFVTGDFDCHQWNKKIFDGLKLCSESSIPYLIQVAQKLRPDLVGKRHLIMDAEALNPITLAGIAQQIKRSGKLDGLFPDRELDIRPTHLAIHRKEECGEKNVSLVSNVRGKGYLGTLVILMESTFAGGYVHLSRKDEEIVFQNSCYVWYAYAAGTVHKMEPIEYGTRISLQYDIYDAGSTIMVHDPFRSYAIGSTTDFTTVVTRTIVSHSLRHQVAAAVKAEFSKADVLVLTLQYLYPAESMQPDALLGGDKALYDILCMNNTYNVYFVNATLLYRLDFESSEQILESSTYRMCNCKGAVPTSNNENTKFIIPTKLTSKHRAERNNDAVGPYFVKALCVRNRKI